MLIGSPNNNGYCYFNAKVVLEELNATGIAQ